MPPGVVGPAPTKKRGSELPQKRSAIPQPLGNELRGPTSLCVCHTEWLCVGLMLEYTRDKVYRPALDVQIVRDVRTCVLGIGASVGEDWDLTHVC
jgi:hypothetical protein